MIPALKNQWFVIFNECTNNLIFFLPILLQGNIKELTIEIPHKLHNSTIGAKGRLVRAIMEECGGVIIRFPPEGSNSDKVTIRGPKEDAESARKQLLELANEKVSSTCIWCWS